MANISDFDAIRPYNDDEVRPVIDRMVNDSELLDSVSKFKLPLLGRYLAPLIRPFVRQRLKKELAHVNAVHDLQTMLERYMTNMIGKTVDSLSISGLEYLDTSRAFVFVSNHRDIAMDPAFVNWTLFQSEFTTLRIAIGDNLLTKPFASDLMRLNKSFIVNRSAKAPREKLKAAKLLSRYIHHSVANDKENVWIAQREGRAKDGVDVTNPAIVSMLMLNKHKQTSFNDYLAEMPIVPVSISYEYDPCDVAKAREIVKKETAGEYQKGEHEDVQSIAKGIVGYKGNVHLSFGKPLEGGVESVDDIVSYVDTQIRKNYVVHLTNCFAYEMLEKTSPTVAVGEKQERFSDLSVDEARNKFQTHVEQCPEEYKETLLKAYAAPVYAKLSLAS